MTQDEIIKFAREAGFVWSLLQVVDKHRMERFATLVADSAAAKEREACALLVEKKCAENWVSVDKVAAAIRARGQR